MGLMAEAALESVKAFFIRVGSFVPTLLGAILILVIGWIAARALQTAFVRVFRSVDGLAEKLGVGEFLRKGEIKAPLSELLGVFLYWLALLATFLAALNALGLTVAAELLERVLGYVLNNVLGGVVVLILGLFFATLVGGVVQTAAANSGISQAKGLGQIARVAVIVFAAVIALERFLSSVIIQTAFNIVVAAIAFGFALAFGLGSKDIAGKYLGEFIDKIRRR